MFRTERPLRQILSENKDSGAPHGDHFGECGRSRMRVLDPKASDKDRGDVQTRMLGSEVLDVDRFPKITFQSSAIQRAGSDGWLVRGELGLHGQTHAISVKVVLEGQHYTPIRIAGGTVQVKDDVKIDFDIVAAER